jgi:hypothetical protein
MAIILKANKFNLFVFWYHSPNVLDTPHSYLTAGNVTALCIYISIHTDKNADIPFERLSRLHPDRHISSRFTNTLALYELLAVKAKARSPAFAYKAVTCLQAHTH